MLSSGQVRRCTNEYLEHLEPEPSANYLCVNGLLARPEGWLEVRSGKMMIAKMVARRTRSLASFWRLS